MVQESMEVKVARLETKMDTILKEVAELNRKLESNNHVSQDEFKEFKKECSRHQTKNTMLTAIITFIITALISYAITNVLA